MSRILFFFAFFLLILSKCVNAQADKAEKQPNILWLVTEDISPYISAYGDATAKTPNLDWLAHEGVVYTNVFDVSGVCAPSRSALITGMYPTSIGTDNMRTANAFPEIGIPKYSVVVPPQVKMFSEILRANGYYTTNNAKQDYQFAAPRSGWDESSKTAHWRNNPGGKPFFSVFNFEVTHESQIWEKKNDPLLVDPAKVPLPPYYPDDAVIRKDVARMYSNIMEMDTEVGEILNQLKKDNLLDNTIIVWYSDNGGPLPRGKREVYDSGLRVPMIIRFPDKKMAGTRNDQLVSFVDFAPSMLSLAGVKPPGYMQGQAFLGKYKAATPRKYIFAARDRMDSEYDMVRAAGDGQYKYIKNFQPEKPYMQNIKYRKQMDLMNELLKLNSEGKLDSIQKLWFRQTKEAEELYDTKADPFELHNLASNPKYFLKKAELRNQLEKWMKLTNDKGFIPEKEWIASFWPNMVQPVTKAPEFVVKNNLVRLSSKTEGSSISYKILNAGQEEKAIEWQLYVEPVALADGQKMIAVADRIGFKGSKQITVGGDSK